MNRDPVSARGIFAGDNPDASHAILWDKDGYLRSHGGAWPEPSERARVVVIGGGMSGLLTAYQLRGYQPVVLERAERFGGNSQGESWNGIGYSIGAAYIARPKKGDAIDALLRELSAYELFEKYGSSDREAGLLDGTLRPDFWDSAGSRLGKTQLGKIRKRLQALFRNEGAYRYPEIPPSSDADWNAIDYFDQFSFRQYLEDVAGQPLSPEVSEAFELYCWGALGASASAVSAASAVNFAAAEEGELLEAATGNSALAERLLEAIAASGSPDSLRPETTVVDVRVAGSKVHVSYVRGGELATMEADAAVICSPGFIAGKLVDGLPEDRLRASSRCSRSAYLVANAYLDIAPKLERDTFLMLGDGSLPGSGTEEQSHRKGATEAMVTLPNTTASRRSVLTVFRPMPYPASRSELLAPDAWKNFEAELMTQLRQEILPPLGGGESSVKELRFARWGHTLPAAAPGFYLNRAPNILRRPHQDRIFFAHHDVWALPAFEACFAAARDASRGVSEILAAR